MGFAKTYQYKSQRAIYKPASCLALLICVFVWPWAIRAQEATLYVDPQHSGASDTHPGSFSQPFFISKEAASHAFLNKQQNQSTPILAPLSRMAKSSHFGYPLITGPTILSYVSYKSSRSHAASSTRKSAILRVVASR